MVEPIRSSESGDWDAFLRGTPGAVFAHSAAHRDLLAAELGCEPEYLVAREAGEIRGALPVMWAGDEGGRICNSLPFFGSHGGPVAVDRRAERALLDAWNERATDAGTLAATMVENPFTGGDSAPVHGLRDERISQYTVLAGTGADGVMALISGEARNNVRRAERRGVAVELDNAAITEVSEIHRECMEALGAPARSDRFFRSIPAHLRAGEDFDIWIARIAGQVAAALLVIRFNGVSEYFASGGRAALRRHNPHPALIFAAMRHEAGLGARIWNWGGTHHGMDGVFRFKAKWGSRRRPYRYFVQVNDRSLLESSPAELVERFPGFYVLPFSALRPALV